VTYGRLRSGTLLVNADPYFVNRRDYIVALAARLAIPAIYEQREFAVAGGLASYGTSLADAYRQVASTPAVFSRVRSRPTCRSCSPPNSSS
jgi:putative ABC transport system substrate-binding protein